MMMKLSLGFSELLFLLVEMRMVEFVSFEDLGTVVALKTLLFTLVALVMVELSFGFRHYYFPRFCMQ